MKTDVSETQIIRHDHDDVRRLVTTAGNDGKSRGKSRQEERGS
jgi:hypothetical protein